MRSIYTFLTKAYSSELIAFLNSACDKRNGSGEAWIINENLEPILYIERYENEYWNELDVNQFQLISDKLNQVPKSCLVIDISRKYNTYEKLYSFLCLLGTVSDYMCIKDSSEDIWSNKEISNNFCDNNFFLNI